MSKLTQDELAEFIIDMVEDGIATLGAIATCGPILVDVLRTRSELERDGFLTDDLKRIDRQMILISVSDQFAHLAEKGPEWPLHLVEIRRGTFPLERIPEHIRSLAEELYYHSK